MENNILKEQNESKEKEILLEVNQNIENDKEMDLWEAILLVNPQTHHDTLNLIPEEYRERAYTEACELVVLASQRNIIIEAEKTNMGFKCPTCGTNIYDKRNFCHVCGQALDCNGHSKIILENKPQIILPN